MMAIRAGEDLPNHSFGEFPASVDCPQEGQFQIAGASLGAVLLLKFVYCYGVLSVARTLDTLSFPQATQRLWSPLGGEPWSPHVLFPRNPTGIPPLVRGPVVANSVVLI